MENKEYKCPNISDKKDVKAPPSARADSTHERISQQMQEVIAATVYAQTYPDRLDNKLAKKFRKEEEEKKNEQ